MLDKSISSCFDIKEAKQDLKDIKTQLEEDVNNPNEVLRKNIDRAQRLLDKIEDEWDVGTTANTIKLVEIAAKLIDCITTAANSMITNDVSLETTNQKQEYLDLKKLEFELKKTKTESIDSGKQPIVNNTQNNVYLTSREDILKLALQQSRELELPSPKN